MQALIWGLKCLLSMLRCMLGSVKGVKSENPKGKGEIRQLFTFLPGKEAILPQQLLTFLPVKVAVPPRPLLTFLPGKEAVIPRQIRQAIKLGQADQAPGILPGIGHPKLPRGIVLPPRQTALTPGKTSPLLPSPTGFPKGLLMKNLTLSGSLTYPANL